MRKGTPTRPGSRRGRRLNESPAPATEEVVEEPVVEEPVVEAPKPKPKPKRKPRAKKTSKAKSSEEDGGTEKTI